MGTRTPLSDKPDMDALRIGPAGETFAQLKQAVVDARVALVADSCQETVDRLNGAIKMLRAAYTRVGLKYRAP